MAGVVEAIAGVTTIIASDLPTQIVIPALSRVTLTTGLNDIAAIDASQILAQNFLVGNLKLYLDGVQLEKFPPIASTDPVVDAVAVGSSISIVDLPVAVTAAPGVRTRLTNDGNTIDDVNSSSILASNFAAGAVRLYLDGVLVVSFPPLSTVQVFEALPTPAATPVITALGIDLVSVSGEEITLGQKDMDGSLPVVLPSDQLFSFSGDLTNNDAAPASANIGALVALANAAAPTWTEGNQVLLSVDLGGALRVSGSSGGGVAQTQVRDAGDTAWVNVGPAAANAKMPSTLYTSAGVETGIAAAPLQVSLANTGVNATPVTVGGTVAATQGTSPWVENLTQVGGSPLALGQTVMADSVPVVIASDQSALPVTFSGTNDVNLIEVGGSPIALGQALMAASLPVVIASDQGAVPVSGTVSATQGTSPWVVSGTVTANQGTSPWVISGTVTANAGTNLNTSALALAATQTDRTQKTQITDGTRDGTVKAASTAAIATDTSFVVALSPNSPLPAGTADIGKIRFSLPTTDAMSEAIIDFNATGDNSVVAGVGGQTIRIYRIFFVLDADSNITFTDTTPTPQTGVMAMKANGAMVLDLQGEPWFTVPVGKDFVINQSGTAQISGRVYYAQS